MKNDNRSMYDMQGVTRDRWLSALPDADFRGMLVFVLVVETGSLLAAARVLGRTEAAVSLCLSRFRSRCTLPLFTREGRALVPTPQAQILARELRQSFSLINRTAELMKKPENPDTGA